MERNNKTGKKLEALWDCPYCGQKGIGGLTKTCPNCGHAQDADTQFYLGEKKAYLDEEKAGQYGKGADWVCAYCGSLNRYNMESCNQCGAPREEQKGDYFSNKDESAKKPQKITGKKPGGAGQNGQQAEQLTAQNASAAAGKGSGSGMGKARNILLIAAAALVLLIAGIFFMTRPRDLQSQVDGKSWARSIQIEQLQTMHESDWYVPDGATVTDEKQEIRSYIQVLDHYEDVEVQKSRTVQDGYDEETTYTNNGDGTYTENVTQVPRYTTEYYTETESQPVYRNDPVYDTKYYYDIDRWIPERTVDTSGTDDEPYWGDVTLASDEREGNRSEDYYMDLSTDKGKTYSICTSRDIWDSFGTGESVKLTVSSGEVEKINDRELH